jgi:hypothetical protein
MIDTKCPYCFVESEADDYLLGRSVRCPNCRKVYLLHAHSTELLLDPIIPGVPRPKPDGTPAEPSPEKTEKAKSDTAKIQTERDEHVARMTLKLKSIRKPTVPREVPVSPLLDRPAPVSPLLDREPPLLPPEPMVRHVEIVGLNIPFWTLFKTTLLVMVSILIVSVAFGLLALVIVAMLAR